MKEAKSRNKSKSPYKSEEVRKIDKEDGRNITDSLPELIRTSILIQDEGKDYKVIIKMPSIEYTVASKNFTFLKTLTRSETLEYV